MTFFSVSTKDSSTKGTIFLKLAKKRSPHFGNLLVFVRNLERLEKYKKKTELKCLTFINLKLDLLFRVEYVRSDNGSL